MLNTGLQVLQVAKTLLLAEFYMFKLQERILKNFILLAANTSDGGKVNGEQIISLSIR